MRSITTAIASRDDAAAYLERHSSTQLQPRDDPTPTTPSCRPLPATRVGWNTQLRAEGSKGFLMPNRRKGHWTGSVLQM